MAKVDFPLPVNEIIVSIRVLCYWGYIPVRPRTPTRSRALKENDTPCSTAGSSGAYLTSRSSTTTRESFD